MGVGETAHLLRTAAVHCWMNLDRTLSPSRPARRAQGPGWSELLQRCWAEDPEQRPDFG